jgi:hypothetical protein
LNITGTFQVVFNPIPTTSTSPFEPSSHFYVEMPQSFATPTNNKQDELVVKLEDYNLKLVVLTMNQIRPEELQINDLLSLPRLPTKIRDGKKLLVDYSNSCVVTLD